MYIALLGKYINILEEEVYEKTALTIEENQLMLYFD